MLDILIIAHFTQVPGEQGNGRFDYIANGISSVDANVEVVTTEFSHRNKEFRRLSNTQVNGLKYKLTLLYEPGYKDNISFSRMYSHLVLSFSLKKYLKERKFPSVIYCSVPSLSTAYVTTKYCKKHKIPLLIDIQDLWPEAFSMTFKVPILTQLLFFPLRKEADFIYSNADAIFAVSETYAKRARKVNCKTNEIFSVFLGTELKYFDQIEKSTSITKTAEEFWIVYIGTLSYSYDLITVIDALEIIKKKGINNFKFIVMGDGTLKSKFEDYADKKEVPVMFTGRLNYEKMVSILKICDIAVNPIKPGSAGSIINKVGDYAAAGLAVLNTQESIEYRNLIDQYNAGINCLNSNSNDLADKIIRLYSDDKQRLLMGRNSRILAEERFNRQVTYSKIFELIISKAVLSSNMRIEIENRK